MDWRLLRDVRAEREGPCVSKARRRLSGPRQCRDAEASNDRKRFGTGRTKAGGCARSATRQRDAKSGHIGWCSTRPGVRCTGGSERFWVRQAGGLGSLRLGRVIRRQFDDIIQLGHGEGESIAQRWRFRTALPPGQTRSTDLPLKGPTILFPRSSPPSKAP